MLKLLCIWFSNRFPHPFDKSVCCVVWTKIGVGEGEKVGHAAQVFHRVDLCNDLFPTRSPHLPARISERHQRSPDWKNNPHLCRLISFYLLLRPLPSALLTPLIESFGFLPPRHISGFLLQMISSPRFIESKKKLLFKQSYRIGIQHYIIPSYLHSLFTLFKGGSFHLPSYRYSNEKRKISIPKLKK